MSGDQGKPSPRHGLQASRRWQDLIGSRGKGQPGKPAARGYAGLARFPDTHAGQESPGEAPATWSPQDGDACIRGDVGQGVIALKGLTLTQLIIAINVLEPGLALHLDRDGGLGFADRAGEPSRFSGDMTIRGATLRFSGVSRIIPV